MAESLEPMIIDLSSINLLIGALLDIGITFATYFFFRAAVQNWTVKDYFAFFISQKNDKYTIYICCESTCHWAIKAKHNHEKM